MERSETAKKIEIDDVCDRSTLSQYLKGKTIDPENRSRPINEKGDWEYSIEFQKLYELSGDLFHYEAAVICNKDNKIRRVSKCSMEKYGGSDATWCDWRRAAMNEWDYGEVAEEFEKAIIKTET